MLYSIIFYPIFQACPEPSRRVKKVARMRRKRKRTKGQVESTRKFNQTADLIHDRLKADTFCRQLPSKLFSNFEKQFAEHLAKFY